MVERLVPPRPRVVAHNNTPRTVALRAPPHPTHLVGIFPQQERHKFRSMVGLFPFRALQGVHELRRKLADPTPDLGPSTLWITRFTGTQYTPRQTPQNLRDHVGAPTGTQKRKRIPNDEAPIIDVDLWLHEAHQANDDGGTCGEWHTHDAACLTPLNLTHYRLAIWCGGFAYRIREPSVIRM